MRTTISLDGNLLEQLKKRSAASGSTVSRLIEDAVRILLSRPARVESSDGFELVTYGAGGRFSTYNIDKTAGLIAAEDLERYGED